MIDEKITSDNTIDTSNKNYLVPCPRCKSFLKVKASVSTFMCPTCKNVFYTEVTKRPKGGAPVEEKVEDTLAVAKSETPIDVSQGETPAVAPQAKTAEQPEQKKPFIDRFKSSFDKWKGWIYLLPAIILLLVFTVWPIFNTLRLSMLEDYNGMAEIGGATFNFGFGNFSKVIHADNFLTCLKNTLLLTIITVPLSTFLALLIAVCLNAIKPLQRLFQTIFFLPYVTNSIAIGMVFAAMFNIIGNPNQEHLVESFGLINNVLGLFGVEPINWMNVGSEYWANMAVLIVYIVWNALPFKILILLGGLQSVNKQYYEAAQIDSTPRWRVFTRITVPLLSPMIAYVVITGFIGGFKEYSSIVGIFDDSMGPVGNAGSLNTMVGYIYDSIPKTDYGEASAAALILFAIIFVITMINLYVSKKKTHY